jgi:ribosome maturation factor RimP
VAEVGATFFIFLGTEVDIAKDVESLIAPLLADSGVELVDVEWRREAAGLTLRVLLDKPGGIGVEDCAAWSGRIGEAVERAGVIGPSYSMEVSSPGLDRPLKKRADFERHLGCGVIVKTLQPLNNQRNFRGKMVSLEAGVLKIADRTSGLVELPLEGIQRARLDE